MSRGNDEEEDQLLSMFDITDSVNKSNKISINTDNTDYTNEINSSDEESTTIVLTMIMQ